MIEFKDKDLTELINWRDSIINEFPILDIETDNLDEIEIQLQRKDDYNKFIFELEKELGKEQAYEFIKKVYYLKSEKYDILMNLLYAFNNGLPINIIVGFNL